MSSGTDAGPPEPEALQFDQAEFDHAPPEAIACAACRREIADRYFEINGTVVCEACKGVVASRLGGGSGFVRFLRALSFGTAAAVVGSSAYAASIWLTGIDLSLVSIFVGYLIGRAVRVGSQGRGGLVYQILAILITYLAIGATHVALAFLQPGQDLPGGILFRVVLFAISTVITPVRVIQESVISIAIIGFALWQAWKMNVRLKLIVTGPYRVGEAGDQSPVDGAPAHA